MFEDENDEAIETETLEQETDDVEEESEATEDKDVAEEEESTDDSGEDGGEEGEEVLIVTIGDEEEAAETTDEIPSDAPEWVTGLRAKQKEQKAEIRQLKKDAKARDDEDKRVADEQKAVEVGDKPVSIDFEDDDDYDKELLAWHARKAKVEDQTAAAAATEKKQNEAWQESLSGYDERKAKLSVSDFKEAEEDAAASLSVIQQHIIIKGSPKAELIMYAIGKNPTVLERLSKIADPIEFAVEIGRIESQMKTRTSKKSPGPERRLKGGGGTGGMGNSTLENLEKEAEKSGDRSKITAYKREQRRSA